MHGLRNKPTRLIAVVAVLLALGVTIPGEQSIQWQPVGQPGRIELDDGVIRIRAASPTTAGVVSQPLPIASGVNAIFVTADVDQAALRGITLAVHDADDGTTLGYWQNPVAIVSPVEIAAVLPLATPARRVRLFAGTHDRASTTEIRNFHWRPVRRGMSHDRSIYGVRIDGSTAASQTFKATGVTTEAVVIRVRQLKAGVGGPDLRVRLYEWAESVAKTVAQPPLAETIVARHLMPGDKGVGGEEMVATYGEAEIDLSVPLSAVTQPGKAYMLELAVDGPCEPAQGFISYGWMDGYPDGQLYKNQAPQGQDLWLEVYHADR